VIDDILARIFAHEWRVVLVMGVVLVALAEAGFPRFGLRLHAAGDACERER
jgi:hypothetical protein